MAGALYFLLCVLFGLVILLSCLEPYLYIFEKEKSILKDETNWAVLLVFLFGLTGVFTFTWQLIKLTYGSKLSKALVGWKFPFFALCLISSFYLIGTVINHLWFFSGNYGVAFTNLGAKDIPCQTPFLIRREKDGVRYRCPTGVIPGHLKYNKPFFPWPDYKEGKSVELQKIFEDLRKKSK